jgi:N-acetylmuramic acid 6-phosphate etherase
MQAAEHFLRNETQFHLGFLPTEQSHPKTRGLAETLKADVGAGIRLLQAVDADVTAAATQAFSSGEYHRLVRDLAAALRGGRRICFSGCGATGRLSILLESCWRRSWLDLAARHADHATLCAAQADRVCSLMTGGDYALIRSVENFEDHASFGRQQVREAGLGPGDVLVAISEGGETSSVIGTVLEANQRGASAFFVFNNPAAILARHIERSRQLIDDPSVTKLDLTTGPMAVAGSTRMQATTAELLVVGTALEEALAGWLPDVLPPSVFATIPREWRTPQDGVRRFEELLADLAEPAAVEALAAWVETERALYARKGRVTYFADECLLDILTDTTERAPTFMLPPYRKCDDPASPPSWAFVKDPSRDTPATWRHALGREPRCLEWDQTRYEELDGPAAARANPPRLGCAEILKFLIGNEDDPSRHEALDSAAIAVLMDHETRAAGFGNWLGEFGHAARPFGRRLAVVFGRGPLEMVQAERSVHVPCRLASTPLGLWRRLAAKLVLNTVSTATMGCLGRLSSNWMANVEPTNKKLIDRGTRLIAELAGVDYEAACHALHQTMADLRKTTMPGQERPSPVAVTIDRLRKDPSRTPPHPSVAGPSVNLELRNSGRES